MSEVKIVMEECDFRDFSSQLSQKSLSKKINWVENWPVVYVLNNSEKKKVYVGQTNKLIRRLKQHTDSGKRSHMKKVQILIDSEANLSYTLDIESFLIKYISADNTYVPENNNKGFVNFNYFNKEESLQKFKTYIWPELLKNNIVSKSIQEIENSDLFKYSPYTTLSTEQNRVVEEILDKLENNLRHNIQTKYVINGAPGTGKTLVAIAIIKLLKLEKENFETDLLQEKILCIQNSVQNIALVIPQSALRKTLKKVFRGIPGLNPAMVVSPTELVNISLRNKHLGGKYFDLVIVDETHRLKQRRNISNHGSFINTNKFLGLDSNADELDWILECSKNQLFFYDEFQSIKPSDISEVSIHKRIYDTNNILELTSQFRVNAGDDYIQYVRDILDDKKINYKSFKNYDLRFFDSFSDMYSEIQSKEKTDQLSRLIAGYGFKWISKKNKSLFDFHIEGISLQWNHKLIDWVNICNPSKEIGCIHTIQGYDLNYAGVTFGPEISYDVDKKKIVIVKDKYFDRNGKAGIKDDEILERYIKNIYSVLLTRGIKGTYIYVCDKNLREYLRFFFQNQTNSNYTYTLEGSDYLALTEKKEKYTTKK